METIMQRLKKLIYRVPVVITRHKEVERDEVMVDQLTEDFQKELNELRLSIIKLRGVTEVSDTDNVSDGLNGKRVNGHE